MGCYAVKARERGIEVILATNDKDLYQLVNSTRENLQHREGRSRFAQGCVCVVRRRRSDGEMGCAAALIGDVLAISGRCGRQYPRGRRLVVKRRRSCCGNSGASTRSWRASTGSRLRRRATNWRPRASAILQNRKMVELDCDLPLPVPIDEFRITPGLPAIDRSAGESTNSNRSSRKCATKRLAGRRRRATLVGSLRSASASVDQDRTVRAGVTASPEEMPTKIF